MIDCHHVALIVTGYRIFYSTRCQTLQWQEHCPRGLGGSRHPGRITAMKFPRSWCTNGVAHGVSVVVVFFACFAFMPIYSIFVTSMPFLRPACLEWKRTLLHACQYCCISSYGRIQQLCETPCTVHGLDWVMLRGRFSLLCWQGHA